MGFTDFLEKMNKIGDEGCKRLYAQAQKDYGNATRDYDNGKISFEEYERRIKNALDTMERTGRCLDKNNR